MRRMMARIALVLSLALLVPALPAAAALEDSIDGFLAQLPADFETIQTKTVAAKLNAGENYFVLDVREPDEFKAGHIEGAVNAPIRGLMKSVGSLPKDKSAPIAVICKSGIRGAYGVMALKLLGYKDVKDVAGGMMAWEKDGLPMTK